MPPELTIEEYRALRATIRERGTMRMIVAAVTFVSWGGMAIAVPALLAVPILALVPLVVLAAGFEVVFAAHVGVERVGRYIQVRYERPEARTPGWEHAAMGLGSVGTGGVDPLFAGLFASATMLNLVPIGLLSIEGPQLFGVISLELAVYGLLHLIFITRLFQARRFAARQRQLDLAHFTATE